MKRDDKSSPARLLALVLLMAGACQTTDNSLRDYQAAIQGATVSGASDRRLELRACVGYWELFEKKRLGVYKELSKRRYFELPKRLFVEAGTSGFGTYEYAALYIDDDGGHILSDMFGVSTDLTSPTLAENIDLLFSEIDAARPFAGDASGPTYDGQCIFVTFKHSGVESQFAVYDPERSGLNADDPPVRIINLILDFIGKVSFGSRAPEDRVSE